MPFEVSIGTRAPWNGKMAKVGSDKNARSSAPRNNLRGGLIVSSSVPDWNSKRGYRKEVDAIIQQALVDYLVDSGLERDDKWLTIWPMY